MQSTVSLFEHLYNNIPPLVSDKVKQKMEQALGVAKAGELENLEDLEKTMIEFGYELWPFNQAYREFYLNAEAEMGQHALLPKLSESLKEKYQGFVDVGGSLRDLHSGKPADFFESDERVELCVALVEMQHEVKHFAVHQIISTEKEKYLAKVEGYKDVLTDIKKTLKHLRDLARKEHDHPSLASEILTQVEHFEHGLCLLAPEIDYNAVCQLPEFFAGRKEDLNRLRGIAKVVEIDFYTT